MNVWITLCIILLAGYAALMFFYFTGWWRTWYFSVPYNFTPKTKVSVIVAARNEGLTIERCVRSVLNQDYPKELLEVIVVDDHSLTPPLSIGEGVRIFSLPSNEQGKKTAIAFGIRHATGKLIITTDADCVAGRRWLSTLVAYYEQFHPKMITAPVAFSNEKSWMEMWQSLDLCGMMTITAGAIKNGFPNMCNGANLAYEKKVFEDVGGFHGIDSQPSGDDVMMMMKVSKKYPGEVHFLKSKEAVVVTRPEKTWHGLFQQRLRWLSKGTVFPDWKVSAVLLFSWMFNLSILINFVAGFAWAGLLYLAGISFLLKTLAESPLLVGGCSFFGKSNLLGMLVPAQIIHILYVTVVGAMSRVVGFQWKGRSYH